MPRRPQKKRERYRDYSTVIEGQLYAVVNIPLGGGRFRQKRKKAANRTEARQWAEDQLEQIRVGGIDVTRSTTFGDLAAWYKAAYLRPPVFDNGIKVEGVRDHKRLKAKLDRIIADLGAKQLTAVTEHELRAYASLRRSRDKVSTATINRDLALIRAVFRRGRSASKLLTVPAVPINAAAERERERVLSPDEERRLLAACVDEEMLEYKIRSQTKLRRSTARRQHLAWYIILAVDTGMRASEIHKLDWSDVDLANDIITVQYFNAKTQKTRRIGMTPRVKAVFFDISAGNKRKGPVFAQKSINTAWRTACKRAGITDLHFHDLRHTATTRMIRAGIPHTEVMKITGHTQIKTFLRYLNLGTETVQSAAERLSQYMDFIQPVEASDHVN